MQTRPKRPVTVRRAARPGPIFKAIPPDLRVVNFSLKTEYILTFIVQNISATTHGFQLRGPRDAAFKFEILERVSNAMIRPGLHMSFRVVFFPQEPRDYEDKFLIIPGEGEEITEVSLRCYRDPPVLALPGVVDVESVLVHATEKRSFEIVNTGGMALFSLHSASGTERGSLFVDGPFVLSPSQFELRDGESIVVGVEFSPVAEGPREASVEIRAQHFSVTFSFVCRGAGARPVLSFGICDSDSLFVPFLASDAYSTRKVVLKNGTDVAYPFHIHVVPRTLTRASELVRLYPDREMPAPGADEAIPFKVTPLAGVVERLGSVSVDISFVPVVFAFFSADLVVFADKIPEPSRALRSRMMLTIHVEATSGPPSIVIRPPLVVFDNIVPTTCNRQAIDVVNGSNLDIKMHWRKSATVTRSRSSSRCRRRSRFRWICAAR